MLIGDRIKKIRAQKGISTHKLGELAKISQPVISKLENGKRKADIPILEKIAEALGVSVDRLTGEAASSIIEDRLEEVDMTMEELAEKAQVHIDFLTSLDCVDPIEPHYTAITKVAKVLGMPAGTLRAALARQEPPCDDYDGPRSTVAEDFADVDFSDPINSLTPNTEKLITEVSITDMVNLPVVGSISCGNGVLAYDTIECYEPTPKSWLNGGDYLYTRARGNSMLNARIQNGDLVLIRKQPDVEDGQIAAVLIDEEIFLKRVYKRNGSVILQSENPEFPPMIVDLKNSSCKIIGKLVRVIIKM